MSLLYDWLIIKSSLKEKLRWWRLSIPVYIMNCFFPSLFGTACVLTLYVLKKLTDNPSLRRTGVPYYHDYQHNQRGPESPAKSCDVVHGTSWLPPLLHDLPVMENVAAHMHGTAHHLDHSQAHWALFPGKARASLHVNLYGGPAAAVFSKWSIVCV